MITERRTKNEALLKIIKAQTHVGEFEAAIATAERIEIPEDQEQALITILRSQANSKLFEAAFQTGSDIQQQNTQEDAVVEIAKAYATDRNFSNALEIAERLFNSFKKVKLLKSIAIKQTLVGLAKEARETFALGLNVSFSSADFSSQKVFALIKIVEGLFSGDRQEQSLTYAKNAYDIAQNLNTLQDRVDVLLAVGEVYAKVGQRKLAKEIFLNILKNVKSIEQKNSDIVNLSIIELFAKIAIAQASFGDFDDALDTLNNIEKSEFFGYQSQVLKTLAKSHLDSEQKETLKKKLTNFHNNACTSYKTELDFIFNGHPATVWSAIAVAQMELGETEAALKIFAEAEQIVEEEKDRKVKIDPDSLRSRVAASLAEAGYFEMALENVKKIDDGCKQIEALSKIASFQWNKGAIEQLIVTLDMAITAKDKITDRHKQLYALLAIAQIQIIAGQIEQGFRTADPVLTNCPQFSHHIAATLAKVQDKYYFKKLLIICADSFDTAYAMCGHIAALYPEKLDDIARKVNDCVFNYSTTHLG